MGGTSPKVPLRADHRFIKRLIKSTLEGKVEEIPGEYDRIAWVFGRAGGSWERLFLGSPFDIEKLKKVIKTAFDKGYLTKKHKWGA